MRSAGCVRPPVVMGADLFDLADEYEAMLARGLSLSGEDWRYFVEGRVTDLLRQLPDRPRRILDFGCGVGHTTAYFAERCPFAEVVGIDTSEVALARAVAEHGSSRVRFRSVRGFSEAGGFDLCYTNGVFHHIRPCDRQGALQVVWRALRPGGRLALFENNPWNPGTRLVMRRIPFDRDAQTISPPAAVRMLLDAGGWIVSRPRTLFYFPRALSAFRRAEGWLAGLPLGAQYYVVATKVGGTASAETAGDGRAIA